MQRTVLLIQHGCGDGGPADIASQYLADAQCRTREVYPAAGQSLPDPDDDEIAAVIVYGGLQSANDTAAGSSMPAEVRWIERWLDTGKPYFGICLGGQLLARALGACVRRHADGLHEVGFSLISPVAGAETFLAQPHHFYQWHNENFDLPADCRLLASGSMYHNQAFQFRDNVFGIQFHPEVSLGMMSDWLAQDGHKLATCPGAHSPGQQLQEAQMYLPAAAAWLRGFLADWLADSRNAARVA